MYALKVSHLTHGAHIVTMLPGGINTTYVQCHATVLNLLVLFSE